MLLEFICLQIFDVDWLLNTNQKQYAKIKELELSKVKPKEDENMEFVQKSSDSETDEAFKDVDGQ